MITYWFNNKYRDNYREWAFYNAAGLIRGDGKQEGLLDEESIHQRSCVPRVSTKWLVTVIVLCIKKKNSYFDI